MVALCTGMHMLLMMCTAADMCSRLLQAITVMPMVLLAEPLCCCTVPTLLQVRSRHLTYKWGFDGGSNSHCWEVRGSSSSAAGIDWILQYVTSHTPSTTNFSNVGL